MHKDTTINSSERDSRKKNTLSSVEHKREISRERPPTLIPCCERSKNINWMYKEKKRCREENRQYKEKGLCVTEEERYWKEAGSLCLEQSSPDSAHEI